MGKTSLKSLLNLDTLHSHDVLCLQEHHRESLERRVQRRHQPFLPNLAMCLGT